MAVIGITGTRKLERGQTKLVIASLRQLAAEEWHVGDAAGVDRLGRMVAFAEGATLHEYKAGGHEPWQLQERSKRMLDNLVARGGTLHAYPNKPCPAGLHPKRCTSWLGSGTWGTVCYAKSKGVKVELHPLTEDAIAPDWMQQEQLALW